jgi:hypothetical protein
MITRKVGSYQIVMSNQSVTGVDLTNPNYFGTEGKDYLPNAVHQIDLILDDQLVRSVLIGSSGPETGIHQASHIVTNERVVICCGDSIFCFSLPKLSLIWTVKGDSATCFEIYPYKDDYIVHGELEISRIDHHGKLIWQQSGADIFTTLSADAHDFLVTDDYLLATDWDNRQYKFDFDGNIL